MIYYPIIHSSSKHKDLKQAIKNKIGKSDTWTSDIQKATHLLVLGGDGFMLECIKKYEELHKPFIGINCGTLGFLMNDISIVDELPLSEEGFNFRTIYFIKCILSFEDGRQETHYAANDIIIGNSVLDYYDFTIHTSSDTFSVKGTGLVVSNNFGSTSYRLNLGGPLIPTSSNLLGIIGIASLPYKFKLFKPQSIHIDIHGKSKCLCGLDGYSGKYKNIIGIDICLPDHTYSLGFLKEQAIESKRIMMAEQKIGFQ